MKSVIFVLPLIFLSYPLFSQFNQQQIITERVVDRPLYASSFDLDGDGDLDVLASAELNNVIVWFENLDGAGFFSRKNIIFSEADNLRYVTAADLDGDGDLDVISTSREDKTVAWYENENGKGKFGGQKIISNSLINANLVYAADIDQDGDMDVLATSFTGLVWYENTGVGNFGDEKIILDGMESVSSIAIVDLDNDVDLDILVGGKGDDHLFWMKNQDGLGDFSTQQISVELNSYRTIVHAADLDGDADLDIIMGAVNDNGVAWYENLDGLGNFSALKVIATNFSVSGPEAIYAGDMDNDGDLDVISSSSNDDKIAWYENLDGLGDFGPQQLVSDVLEKAHGGTPSDLDSDGDLDILAFSPNGDKIVWYNNVDGLGSFGKEELIPFGIDGPFSVSAGDLNGDGNIDVLSDSWFDDRLVWYKNEGGQGTFGQPQIISDSVYVSIGVHPVDLDGDGDLDVLSGDEELDEVIWFENLDGLGNFGNKQVISNTASALFQIKAGDVDGDSDMDVIAASLYNDQLAWYENDGSGNFGPAIQIGDKGGKSVAPADIDGDGDLDIFAGFEGETNIAWYENLDGAGNFSAQKLIANSSYYFSVVYGADMDGDQDMDVVYAAPGMIQVGWHENMDGKGTFGDVKVISTDPSSTWIYPADLDNDNDIDIVSCSWNITNISWIENVDGLGNFGDLITINVDLDYPTKVFAADLDGDGDIDPLSASIRDDKIAWYINSSEQSSIEGFCFYDENKNGILDGNEIGLKNQNVLLNPEGVASWTNGAGRFSFITPPGTYNISYLQDPDWILTTPGDAEISINSPTQDIVQNFGLTPVNEFLDIETHITSGITRCNADVRFWLNYINSGTLTANGTYTLEIDPLFGFTSAIPVPTSVSGNTLVWDIEDLAPGYEKLIMLNLVMPGVMYIGDEFEVIATAELIDNQGNSTTDVFVYESEIVCSYDPNDKLVNPVGVGEEHYTLFDETLEYTIRFQNSGNDTAFTVVLEDQLDDNLDWNTFRPIASSHEYEVMLYQNGMVKFTFDNILLPDSTTNEIESQGFVKYKIAPKTGIMENTIIENFASIFFDFNPPIITNTTFNTFVSELPTAVHDISTKNKLTVFPNPFRHSITFDATDFDHPEYYEIQILNATGMVVNKYSFDFGGKLNVMLDNNVAGFYLYQLIKKKERTVVEVGKIISI